jgi:hypothetical protein
MSDFDPKNLIDRHAEQELFRNLMTFTLPARMLTIRDGGGRGKSSLLKRLQYNCRREIRPAIPACLIELDQLVDPSPFEFVKQAVERINIPGRFAKFQALNVPRTLKDFTVFGQGIDPRFREPRVGASTQATVGVQGSLGEGAMAVANYTHNENPTFQYLQKAEFTDEQERLARQLCVEAFFEDLRVDCAVQPMVLILDTWERCNIQLRDWIVDEMLANHCFHQNTNLRPDKLAIVVAGRPYDPTATKTGLRDDEFRPLFDTDQDFADTVLSRKSLSEWSNDHIKEFLVLNSYNAPTETTISLIQEQLRSGASLLDILSILEVLKTISRTTRP